MLFRSRATDAGNGDPSGLGAAAVQESQEATSFEEALQYAIEVQERHADWLLAMGSVVGTAVGLGGDGDPVVNVYTKVPGVAGIPDILEGVRVVVEATGEFFAIGNKPDKGGGGSSIDPKSNFPIPVPIGVSTGNAGECSAGTIGARVKGGGLYYALSNNHVFALENSASIGSNILQPGRYDTNCGTATNTVIGTLTDFEPIDFAGGDNTIDAAIALSDTARLGNSTPSNGYGTPNSATVPAFLNQSVQKYGRTSALTKGRVTGLNGTFLINYGSSGTARFVSQIVSQANRGAMIGSGDSGALLVTDPGKNPVGLLFAGSAGGKTAIANPIDLVLGRFAATIE